MKKLFLSAAVLVSLIAFSFTKSNTDSTSEIINAQKLNFGVDQQDPTIGGTQQTFFVGSSATSYPGTIHNNYTSRPGPGTGKMQKVLKKYQ